MRARREEGGVKLLRPFFDGDQAARIRCLVSTSRRGTTYHGVGSSTGGFILVKDGTTPKLEICNHDLPITAAALWAPATSSTDDRELDHEPPLFLTTCCRASIVLSHVHPSLTESSVVWRHKLAATGTQPVSPGYACFDPFTGFLLAVALGREVLVLRVEHGDVLARLRGHGADVAAVHFDPHRSHILASCAEDGMLKVWDLSQRSCLAQAHMEVSPGDTLSALGIDHTGETWCVCSSGGRVTLFHCHHEDGPTPTPRSVGPTLPLIEGAQGHNQAAGAHEAVHLVEAFTVTLPKAGRVRCVDDDKPEFELRVEDSLSVLGLGFVEPPRGSEAVAGGGEACVHIVTSEGVFLLACRSGRIRVLALPDSVASHCPFGYAVVGSSVALLACALQPLCVALPLTALRPQPSLPPLLPPTEVDDVQEAPEAEGPEEEEEEGPPLSLFPSPTMPIPSWSPLAAVFQNQTATPVKKSMAYDNYDKPPGHKKVPVLHDRPVVFHARIRSSGYGTPSKTHKTGKTSSTSASKSKPCALSSKRYPLDCGPLTKHQAQHDASPRLPPILSLAYFEAAGGGTAGAGGSCIAASTIDGAVHVMRLPIAKHQGEGFALCGHGKSPVRGVCPSHAPGLLLSCSDDGSAKLWAPHVSHTAAALAFHPPPPSPSSSSTTPPPAVMHAQFFYLDKFVLLCAGRCAYLYRYTLQLPGKDALLRHPPPSGSAKAVHCFSLPHTQKIVAMDALNAVLSPIIIAAGSDRSLSVLDAGHGKVLRTLHCAHARAVHSVALPKPSPFAPLPPERLDVFATAATDNVVTLWDVRSKLGRVASFREHVNRRERVALSLSPCMRYVAVGSEDRCLYLYDARRGAAAAKTQCHEDVVSCAAFHPLHPQLATAGYDGALRFFTSHESQLSQLSQERLHSKTPSPLQPPRSALVRR